MSIVNTDEFERWLNTRVSEQAHIAEAVINQIDQGDCPQEMIWNYCNRLSEFQALLEKARIEIWKIHNSVFNTAKEKFKPDKANIEADWGTGRFETLSGLMHVKRNASFEGVPERKIRKKERRCARNGKV